MNALKIADEFPITTSSVYLNTAAQGPWPTRTTRAVQQFADSAQFPGPDNGSGESDVFAETRTRLARLLNTAPEHLVFGPNTSYGLNVCMHGIDWRAGDNVVMPADEFPSVKHALTHLPNLGVEVRTAAWQHCGPSGDEIMSQVDGRTRAVICSAIAWNTGFRIDLEALGTRCAAAGVLLIVDGIHAVGAEPLDLSAAPVSALAFHGYKWLLAGFGMGGLYVAPHAIEQIRPTFVGPQSLNDSPATADGSLPWQAGAQRYAVGNANKLGATVLCSSLSLIEEIGIDAIRNSNHALADMLMDGLKRVLPSARILRSNEARHQSAIVVFTTGDVARDSALVDQLSARGIMVALRPAGIRVSPHFFNRAQDIERLLDALS